MARLFWICLGGAFGTGCRYLLSSWLQRQTGAVFPWGTLAVNTLGSFLLGLLMEVALATETFPLELRLALTTGVMGGFTTYSTFNYETLQLFREGSYALGLAYLAATVVGCLAAGILGWWAGRALSGG
jgi:CrcB protein